MTPKSNQMTDKKRTRRDYEGDLVAGLIDLMEAGTNPWQREWTAASAVPHMNLTTKQPYKGSNPALLELQMQMRSSSLPLWIPGGQGKARGWRPKKGSKACCICCQFPAIVAIKHTGVVIAWVKVGGRAAACTALATPGACFGQRLLPAGVLRIDFQYQLVLLFGRARASPRSNSSSVFSV